MILHLKWDLTASGRPPSIFRVSVKYYRENFGNIDGQLSISNFDETTAWQIVKDILLIEQQQNWSLLDTSIHWPPSIDQSSFSMWNSTLHSQ